MRIKQWFLQFLEFSPSYGHFAKPSKSNIVVKEQHPNEAENQFADMEVMLVPASHFLGGCVGCKSEVCEFVCCKVRGWVDGVECLVKATNCYPQSAYAVFTHSLPCEWTYLQRIVTGCDNEYIPLHDTIKKVFIPALLGQEVF